jgi:hypothetical protein
MTGLAMLRHISAISQSMISLSDSRSAHFRTLWQHVGKATDHRSWRPAVALTSAVTDGIVLA